MNVEGHTIERRSRDDGIKVLGCIVSCSGTMDSEIDARISCAWGAFYANKSTLCCFAVPLRKRLQLLQMVVEPSFFWCAGTWKITLEHYAYLKGVQREILRRMIRCPRIEGEVDDDFFPRQQQKITGPMDKHSVRSWDTRARDYYFRWAGQVARLGRAEPHRLTPMLLALRSITSIIDYAARNGGNQRHGRACVALGGRHRGVRRLPQRGLARTGF